MKKKSSRIIIAILVLFAAAIAVLAIANHYRIKPMRLYDYDNFYNFSLHQGESKTTEYTAKKQGVYCLNANYHIGNYKNYSEHEIECGATLTDSDNFSVYSRATNSKTKDILNNPYAVVDPDPCERNFCYTLLKENEKCIIEAQNYETDECSIDLCYELYYYRCKEMKTGINQSRATGASGLYYFTAEKDGYYNFKSYFGGIINPELDFLCDYSAKVNGVVAVMDDIIYKDRRNIDCTVKLEKGRDYAFMITAPHSEKVALPFILDISFVGAKP